MIEGLCAEFDVQEGEPMTSTVPSVVFGASALLLIGLSVPLARRRVRPNRLYGFRTSSTLNDERLWYEVNAKTGVDLLIVGVGLFGITIAHVVGAISEQVFLAIAVAWTTSGALWSTVHEFTIIGRRRT
jgi:uncharacterized membrane protein